jgi:hypothetical protein
VRFRHSLFLLDHAKPGERSLFSTDPAHSISDSLNVPVAAAFRSRAKQRRSSRAWEINAAEALDN